MSNAGYKKCFGQRGPGKEAQATETPVIPEISPVSENSTDPGLENPPVEGAQPKVDNAPFEIYVPLTTLLAGESSYQESTNIIHVYFTKAVESVEMSHVNLSYKEKDITIKGADLMGWATYQGKKNYFRVDLVFDEDLKHSGVYTITLNKKVVTSVDGENLAGNFQMTFTAP